MRKLSLANLAQNELQKNEANKVRGGACPCSCGCICPPDYKMDIQVLDKTENITSVQAGGAATAFG